MTPKMVTPTDQELEKRVAAGAAWLDSTVPDWRERVTPARINMLSELDCMLGQVFGSYNAGRGIIERQFPMRLRHGGNRENLSDWLHRAHDAVTLGFCPWAMREPFEQTVRRLETLWRRAWAWIP